MFTSQSCALDAMQLRPGQSPPRPRSHKAPPLPPSYFGRRRRVTSAVTGALRILFALATIPIALESVREGNYPGDGAHQYVAFYWTESLMILVGLFGLVAAWKVNHFNGSLLIGCVVPVTQFVMGVMGCIHDGHGVNPTPSYYERRGEFVLRYPGNNANPVYSRLLVSVSVMQMILCFLGCYIHHQSWEKGKKRRNYVIEDGGNEHDAEGQQHELRSRTPVPSQANTPTAQTIPLNYHHSEESSLQPNASPSYDSVVGKDIEPV